MKKKLLYITSRFPFPLEKGDKFYIYSDGIIDQIGGDEGRKWMTIRLKEFIQENNHLPMKELNEKVKATFEGYMEGYKQVDDVLLIGVEI